MLIGCRPQSRNATWEDPPLEGAPFDYRAEPNTFYFDVESVGIVEPDMIVRKGLNILQQKLAEVFSTLQGGQDGKEDGDYSPVVNGSSGANDQMAVDGAYTPYGQGGGSGSAWGGGGTTPYGATPYGQHGGSVWGGNN